MTPNKLASLICKYEGKKVETPVAQVREILKVIATLIADVTVNGNDGDCPLDCLCDYSNKIADKLRKKAAKKKKGEQTKG